MKEKVIRASYDENTITVYQAYNSTIADHAVKCQTFISPPFKKDRMTWIKPSFLWMMYRSGWGTKENQEHILAIRIKKTGFEWALQNGCLTHFNKKVYISPDDWRSELRNSVVRIQWDPEKDILLNPLPYRAIQIGLSGFAVEKYTSDWITQIDDITEYCKHIHQLVLATKISLAEKLLPIEKAFPLTDTIALKIAAY